MRRRASTTMAAFSWCCACTATCCHWQPPQPAATNGHGGSTRSGDATSMSTARARRKSLRSAVTAARTRSPGMAPSTKTTRPSGPRPMASPPAATAVASSSTVGTPSLSPGSAPSVRFRVMAAHGTNDVRISLPAGGSLAAALAQPSDVDATSGSLPGMIVLHEIWGLNDDIRRIAARFADNGYVAVAPDLYSNGNKGLCLTRTMFDMAGDGGRTLVTLEAGRAWLAGRPA